ncbi:MAG TPA: peptidylprolyl isomerase [bacterium]|nr:peptidylprolyl isomerase [bacterium]HPN31919.1 peptidylprolyl isomerase [bacterium]
MQKREIKLIIFGMSLILLFSGIYFSGCKSDGKKEDNAAAQSAVSDKIVVKVNDVPVYEKNVRKNADIMFQRNLIEMQQRGMTATDTQLAEAKNGFYKNALEQAIAEELFLQEIAKKNITASDSEIMLEYNNVIQKSFGGDQKRFQEALKQYDFKDEEEYKKKFKRDYMVIKFVQDELKKVPAISEEKIREVYDKNKEMFDRPESREVRHILKVISKDSNSLEINEKINELKSIRKQILGGAKFETLAQKYSDCPSKNFGGQLKDFSGQSNERITMNAKQIDPDFKKGVFSLKQNKISDLIKTSFGYHLIEVTKINKAGIAPYEEMKSLIEAELYNSDQKKYMASMIDSLKAQAKIVYNP